MSNSIKKKILKVIKYSFIGIAIFLVVFSLAIYLGFDVKRMQDDIEKTYSTSFLDANGVLMDVFMNDDEQWHIKVEDDIPENLRDAVITYEDKNFYSHHGVDFLAIGRAFVKNASGNKRSGASTITMQVAKLSAPKKRTYIKRLLHPLH